MAENGLQNNLLGEEIYNTACRTTHLRFEANRAVEVIEHFHELTMAVLRIH